MTVLPNFPHKDQRTEPTRDGRPPENRNYDCVDVSLAAAIEFWDRVPVSGDELKDAEYGEAWANRGTSLAAYVDQATDRAREVYHVTADPFNSADPMALVRQIHAWVDAGYPVIATIPSAWGSTAVQLGVSNRCADSDKISSHVVVFFATGNGSLTAMNPWGGFDQAESDQWWADRLLFCQVWKVRKEDMAISTSGLGAGFAAYVQEHNVAAKCVSGGEVFKGDYSYATFENGLILFYSQATGVRDNLGHVVIDRLNQEVNAANQATKDRDLKIADLSGKFDQESKDLTQARSDLAACRAEPKGLSDEQKQALAQASAALKPLADAYAELSKAA